MDKFKSVKECIKCGSNLTLEHDKYFRHTKITYLAPIWKEGKLIEPEYLLVCCKDCGFVWKEECKHA